MLLYCFLPAPFTFSFKYLLVLHFVVYSFPSPMLSYIIVPYHILFFQWEKSNRVLFCGLLFLISVFLLKVLLISADVKACAPVGAWDALFLCKCSIISVVSVRQWGCVSWQLCLLRFGNSELNGWKISTIDLTYFCLFIMWCSLFLC